VTRPAGWSLFRRMQTPEKDTNLPDHANEGPTGLLVIAGAAVVSVLLAGVLAWTLMRSSDSSVVVDGETTTSVAASLEPAPTPETSGLDIPVPSDIDESLTAWHDEQAPTLARLLAMLGAAPATNSEQLRTRCKQIGQITGDLQSAPQPQRASVSSVYAQWLSSVLDAVTFCVEGTAALPEKDAIVAANSGLGSTGALWETFFLELARWVDLRRTP
jgi:hypothetical protein